MARRKNTEQSTDTNPPAEATAQTAPIAPAAEEPTVAEALGDGALPGEAEVVVPAASNSLPAQETVDADDGEDGPASPEEVRAEILAAIDEVRARYDEVQSRIETTNERKLAATAALEAAKRAHRDEVNAVEMLLRDLVRTRGGIQDELVPLEAALREFDEAQAKAAALAAEANAAS